MADRKPPVPRGLEKDGAGQTLWRDIVKDYDLRPDELRVLEDICRARDLIAAMDKSLQADLKAGSFTVRGSMGQEVAHPLIGEIRQQRASCATLLKQLKLPDLTAPAAPVRAPGEQQREAAKASWASRSKDMQKAKADLRRAGGSPRKASAV